jgi:TetR/AcrR family acrAB operon transcriptional repressor
MVKRTREEAIATRSRILDTAELVFHEKGVSHTSLADIALAAGVTRGAIYWHFRNKCDLFVAMFDRVKLPLDELLDATLDTQEADPLGRMHDLLVDCLCNTMLNPQRKRVFDILFLKCEFTEEMGPVIVRHQANMQEGRKRIERGLGNAVVKRQLPPDLDTRRAAIMLHAFLGGLLRDWLFLPASAALLADTGTLIDAQFDMLKLSPSLKIGAISGSIPAHSGFDQPLPG